MGRDFLDEHTSPFPEHLRVDTRTARGNCKPLTCRLKMAGILLSVGAQLSEAVKTVSRQDMSTAEIRRQLHSGVALLNRFVEIEHDFMRGRVGSLSLLLQFPSSAVMTISISSRVAFPRSDWLCHHEQDSGQQKEQRFNLHPYFCQGIVTRTR